MELQKNLRSRISAVFSVLAVLSLTIQANQAQAVVTEFDQDLAGFNLAAGSPSVALDFDSIATGTDISGSTINGITFQKNFAPLIVVAGASTFTPGAEFIGIIDETTNKLFPTSGLNVLSPGGLELGAGFDPTIEGDSMTLVFTTAVAAFGMDHLSQSCDGAGFTDFYVFDTNGINLLTGNISVPDVGGGGGAAGCGRFWGLVSDSANIKTIAFIESDDNGTFPDSNIGFDTFRYGAPQTASVVPEPTSMILLGGGLIGAAFTRRRKV